MQEHSILKRVLDILVPFLFLVGITIISSFLYLYKGMSIGDDIAFHLGNIYDCYYGLTHGLSIDSTNHLMLGIYAYNTHLFYAPLPHYFAAILMIIFNCSNIVAMKISVSFFCFLAALFFYLFAKKISNNQVVSLLSAAFFIFCPYRMFCAYCRLAYAETIAISFLPMLFYGIYGLTHDDKPTYRIFLAIIVSISGLILSHPFTALMGVIVALIYMAVRYKYVWRYLSNRKGLIMSASTVILIFSLIGFYFFPMIIAKSANLYRVSDDVVMWTTYEHVAGSTGTSANFSGFINIDWISGRIKDGRWPEDQLLYTYLVELFLVLGAWLLLSISDYFTNKYLKNKYIALGINSVAFWVLPLTFIFLIHDIVFYLASVLIYIVYLISKLYNEKYEEKPNKDGLVMVNKEILIDVIFLLVITVIFLLLIFVGQIWHLLPSIFYSCQFAWRLWSMVTITASWLFTIFLNWSIKSPRRMKYASPLLIVPSLLMIATMSFREKGVALTYEKAGSVVYHDYNEDNAKANSHIGVMNEYMPQIFYQKDYKSEYSNSLYPTIKKTIGHPNQYIFDKEHYLSPSFLEGDGKLTCTYLNTPSATFDATINSISVVQLPQFYYDGYEVKLINKTTSEISYAEIVNIDSLVSFKANEGEYTIEVSYKGPVIRRVFNVFFYIGLSFTTILSGLATYELIKEKQSKNEEITPQEN